MRLFMIHRSSLSTGYVRSYIVSPAYVYGHPQNKLTELGIQNDTNLVLNFQLGTAKERGAMGVLSKGANLFGMVDNAERKHQTDKFCTVTGTDITPVAQLFVLILDKALADPSTTHGREGYYIASEDEFCWSDYVQAFAAGVAEAGGLPSADLKPFTEAETAKLFPVRLYIDHTVVVC